MKLLRLLELSARCLSLFLTVFAVLCAPWLFGCVDPWMFYSIAAILLVALQAGAISLCMSRSARLPAQDLMLLLVVFLGMVGIQQFTISADPKAAHTDEYAAAKNAADELNVRLQQTPGAESVLDIRDESGGALSVTPSATRDSWVFAFCGLSVMFILLVCRPDTSHLNVISWLVFMSCLCLAIYGIQLKASGSRLLLGVYSPRYMGEMFASFTNRNHFAALGNLALGLGIAVVGPRIYASYLQFKSEKHASTSLVDKCHAAMLWAGPACMFASLVILCVAILMTFSRGGMVSMLFGLMIIGVIVARREKPHFAMMVVFYSVMGIFAIGAYSLSRLRIEKRMGDLAEALQNPLDDTRMIVAQDVFRMFLDYPILGSGLGTFQYLYPLYQDSRVIEWRFIHAHNDWIQYLSETGLVGMAVLIAGLICVFRCAKELLSLSSLPIRLTIYGYMFSLITICIHSAFDYSLHKFPILLTVSLIVGMLFSMREISRHQRAVEVGDPS